MFLAKFQIQFEFFSLCGYKYTIHDMDYEKNNFHRLS